MKNVLIITSSIDYTVDYIIAKYKKISFYRLNVDMLPYYKIEITENGWLISTDEWCVTSDFIYSIYYRKPRLPNISIYEPQYINMIQKDIITLIEGIANSFDGVVLSRPHILHNCENKVYQLQTAGKVGFLLPKSIITNNTERAANFVENKTIVKPLTTGKIIYDDNIEIYQTNLIESINENINLTPIYLQSYVRKEYEVRATFIRDKVFCVKIVSSNTIDWRDENAINQYEIIEIPKSIYQKCIKLMTEYKLEFGAFDFIIVPNGEWVFLEVNPNGQWLWLENELNINISGEIVNLLNGEIK